VGRAFLLVVESGVIPRGSFLLVENLDRVSRQTVRKALRSLERIVEAGVVLVTLSDGKRYTEESLDEDPISLIMSILTFVRAHEESALKGRRVRAAWENKRKRAVEEGTPLTKRTPAWLILGPNGKLKLHPKRSAVVRRIFEMSLAGMGQHAIAEKLNREGLAVFNDAAHWHRSYVKKILENPATVGRLIAHRVEYEGGRKVRKPVVEVEGHFPAAITPEQWKRVQEMKDVGSSVGGKSRPAPKGASAPLMNVLAGLARCPKCDGTMTRVSKGPKKGGYPYLVCTRAKAGAGCEYKAVRMETVEAGLYDHFDYLLGTIPTGDPHLDGKLEQLDTALSEAHEQAARVTEAIAQRGLTGALGDRLTTLERAIAELEAEQAATQAIIEDAPLLDLKVTELHKALSARQPDRRKVNALLRQMARAVVVDYTEGRLAFQWKHGGESRVVYAWPTEPDTL
jgi:DNA invertase Pin-like site-specific DNA recombinase